MFGPLYLFGYPARMRLARAAFSRHSITAHDAGSRDANKLNTQEKEEKNRTEAVTNTGDKSHHQTDNDTSAEEVVCGRNKNIKHRNNHLSHSFRQKIH